MRKLLIGLFILVFILAAAVFVGPSLVDWNDYKGRIAEAVERETGRDLAIDGDISLSLLPVPALSVEGVRLANLEGAENPDMASLRALDVRVAFAPLLEGRIQVESLELVEPTIRLEVLPDGRRNWEFTPQEAAASGGTDTTAEQGFGGEVRFDRIEITDGTLIYSDKVSGREERIEDLDARIAADSLKGPFSISGDASYQGVGIDFDGGTGRLAPQGVMPVNLAVTLDGAEGELRFNGSVDQSTTPVSVTGSLIAEGQDPQNFAAALGVPGALPEAIAGPFQVETEIAYGGARLDLSGLSIVLADLRAEGEAGVALGGEVPDAEITLRVSQLNLDTLLPQEDAEEGDGEAQDGAATDLSAFALPSGIDARLDLTVQTMIYKAQVVRDAVLRGRLSGGELQLEEASALLPGGSRLVLDGRVTQAEAGPRLEGNLEAESDNLRTLLGWLGVDVESISAERLRRASLSTKIAATPKQIDLTGIQAELDVSKITGGLAMALGKRPSFGAGLTVDKINLDAYLRGDGLGAESGDGSDSSGEAVNPLAGFDANLDLRAGQVVYQGQTMYDLHLDATVQDGGMTIRTARLGNLANSSATLSGRLEGLPAAPALRDGSFDLEVNDPAAVSRVLGMGGNGPLVRLGPFTAKGEVSGSLETFTLDGEIDAQPVAGTLAGAFSGLPLEPRMENGRFDLTIEDPAALAALAGAGDPDGTLARLGAVTLKGTASGGPQQLSLDATAGVKGGSFAVSGSASNLMDAPSFDLSLDAQHPDLAALIAVFAPGQSVPGGSGGLDLQAQLKGSPERMAATGIQGTIGPAKIAGEAIYDSSAERPLVTAKLIAGELPLAAFGLAGAGSENGGAPAPDDGERWSSEPIETGPLRRIDADIDLKADALIHQDWRMENATVLAKLRDGVLTIERLDGRLFGGHVAVNGTVTAREDIAADLKVRADQVDTAKLVGVLGGIDRVSGPLSFSADLTTRGLSQRELVNNLNGSGVVDGNLQAKASAKEKGLAVLLGFLGSQVKEVQGIADAAFLILNAFAGEAAQLSGTLDIENGVIRTDDGRLEGQGAFALLRGMAADLPAWQIDFATQLFQNADTENPFVTLGLIGALDDPETKLGGLAMQPGAQGGLQGAIQNLTGQGQQQEGQGGLQGVIQGLTGQQQGAQEGGAPQGGLQGLIQGLGAGALGTQQQEQQAAPPEETQEVPEEQAAPEGEAEQEPEEQPVEEAQPEEAPEETPEEVQEEIQEAAPEEPQEAAPEEPQQAPEEEGEGVPESEVAQPTPRPEEVEAAQPPPEAESTQPSEQAQPESQEDQPVEPQQEQPPAEESSGERQLEKLLEGIGVRQPEAPQEDQGSTTSEDSTAQDQTRQTEEPQQEEQPGRNFINNILQGIQKN